MKQEAEEQKEIPYGNGKILTICSSRQRPERCLDMINSWIETVQTDAQLVVYVAENDPKIQKYKMVASETKPNPNIKIVFGPEKSMIRVINEISSEYAGYSYYHEINDDHICRTHGWDRLLAEAVDGKNNGFAIAYGKTKNMPSSVMYGGKIVRLLGYMFPPGFNHSHVDNWLVSLGQSANILKYVPRVNIEHMHHIFGLSKKDKVNEGVEDDWEHGKKVFNEEFHKMPALVALIRSYFPRIEPTADGLVSFAKAGIPNDYGPDHREWNNPGKAAWRTKWRMANGG